MPRGGPAGMTMLKPLCVALALLLAAACSPTGDGGAAASNTDLASTHVAMAPSSQGGAPALTLSFTAR